MGEIQRTKGFSEGAISLCCHGKRNSCYGYIWRYAS